MSALAKRLSENILSCNGFLVRQHRKFVARNRNQDDRTTLTSSCSIRNRGTTSGISVRVNIGGIDFHYRAIVAVKGWHRRHSARLDSRARRRSFDLWNRRVFNRLRGHSDRMARPENSGRARVAADSKARGTVLRFCVRKGSMG